MINLEKYQNAFKETFLVDLNVLPELKYQSINEWDSVGHMGLDIPESVLALKASVINSPCMDMSSSGWFGQWHNKNLN